MPPVLAGPPDGLGDHQVGVRKICGHNIRNNRAKHAQGGSMRIRYLFATGRKLLSVQYAIAMSAFGVPIHPM